MSPPRIRAVHLAGSAQLPTLLVGPSLGTSVSALWRAAAQRMSATHHVIGWDLPGHGQSPAPTTSFNLTDLARSVLNLIDNETLSPPITYAGVSVAGAVGLQLLLDYPERLTSAALICTGVKIGDPDDWNDRAQRVCSDGTPVMIAGAMQRWFAPGFLDRDPDTANALLDSLRHTDTNGYAQTCRALGAFDVRCRLPEIGTPVLAIAGADDIATPPHLLRHIATHVADGRFVELPNTAHLAPAEQPGRTAELITALTGRTLP